jgi:hypothetical protein
MDLLPDFRDLLAEFVRSGVEAVIVGGYAVAFHGHPRSTKDLDIVLAGDAQNLSRAAEALARFGAPRSVVEAVRAMGARDVVWLGQPPARIDLLRSVDGVESESLFARAVAAEVEGLPIRVIALDDLIANKRAVARPQDLVDAAKLERVRASRLPSAQ